MDEIRDWWRETVHAWRRNTPWQNVFLVIKNILGGIIVLAMSVIVLMIAIGISKQIMPDDD